MELGQTESVYFDLKIGDKVVKAKMINGVPTIQCTTRQVPNANGGMDCIIDVPCLNIQDKQLPIGGV